MIERSTSTPAATAVVEHRSARPTRTTWSELADRTARVAVSLKALSVQVGDRVAIVTTNCVEWLCSDLAAQSIGAVSVAVDPAQPAERTVEALAHSEAVVAVVEPGIAYDTILAARTRLRFLRRIVLLGIPAASDDPSLTSFDELVRRGGDQAIDALVDEVLHLESERVATIVYTPASGRAVMLSNHNLVSIGEQLASVTGLAPKQTTGPVHSLSLAHQRAVVAAAFTSGATIVLQHDDAIAVRVPEVVLAGSDSWQGRCERERERARRRRIDRWALRVLIDSANRARAHTPGTFDATRTSIARRLYLRRARERMGVSDVRVAISIGPPLDAADVEMLWALGVEVRSAYGLAESSGVAAIGIGAEPRPGTAGRAIPRGDLRLAVDGELLVRGPHVFVGYFKDEAASRHAVDPDGWLRTGDKATLERDGTLVIVDG